MAGKNRFPSLGLPAVRLLLTALFLVACAAGLLFFSLETLSSQGSASQAKLFPGNEENSVAESSVSAGYMSSGAAAASVSPLIASAPAEAGVKTQPVSSGDNGGPVLVELSAVNAAAVYASSGSLDWLKTALIAASAVCLVLIVVLIRTSAIYRRESRHIRAEKLRLELSEERYRIMAQDSDAIIFELNYADRTAEASENFEKLFGIKPQFDLFTSARYVHPDDRPEFERITKEAREKRRNVTGELRLLDKNAGYTWFSVLLYTFTDERGNIIRLFGKLSNIDSEKREKALLELRAKTDSMTGLLNKTATEKMITLALSEDTGMVNALLIIDVDNLKLINDNYGHSEGDRAILSVASALTKQFRSTDIVGRIGGDEFMAFLINVGSESNLRGAVTALMQRLERVYLGESGEYQLHVSIGSVVSSAPDAFESLYKKADKALYFVKRNGKNDYAIYTPEMEQSDYRFSGNVTVAPGREEWFDFPELNKLLSAVSPFFMLVVSVNLTKNSYRIVHGSGFDFQLPNECGTYNEFILKKAESFHPKDKKSFADVFSRGQMIFAHERGEKCVVFEGRQLGKDGVYRTTQATAVFVDSEVSPDIFVILLFNPVAGSADLDQITS